MGAFPASMLEAMKSLRDEMQSIKKSTKEVELDQSSTSASKPGPRTQPDNLPPNTAPNILHYEHMDEAMECLILLFLHRSEILSPNISDISKQREWVCSSRAKKHWTKANTRFGLNMFLSRHPQRRISPLLTEKRSSQPPRGPSELDQPQNDPDPFFL